MRLLLNHNLIFHSTEPTPFLLALKWHRNRCIKQSCSGLFPYSREITASSQEVKESDDKDPDFVHFAVSALFSTLDAECSWDHETPEDPPRQSDHSGPTISYDRLNYLGGYNFGRSNCSSTTKSPYQNPSPSPLPFRHVNAESSSATSRPPPVMLCPDPRDLENFKKYSPF